MEFGFFHCFSRRSLNAKDYGNELAILQSILECGLLLVPEELELAGERFAGGRLGSPIQFLQRRLSLTLLTEAELPAHRAKFGQFAIEFDPESGRRLGAVPVIYLPQPNENGEYQMLDAISATLLYRLREVFFVLSDLGTLERNVEQAGGTDLIEMSPSVHRDTRTVEVKPLRDILETLGANKQSFEDLAAACQVIFHLFYPTDKRRSEMDSMSLNMFYYQQREWRIISDIFVGADRRERILSDSEKSDLCARDSFFSEPIETTDPHTNRTLTQRRADLCRLLERVDGRLPCEFIRRIWAPPEVRSQVEEMLRNTACAADLVVDR